MGGRGLRKRLGLGGRLASYLVGHQCSCRVCSYKGLTPRCLVSNSKTSEDDCSLPSDRTLCHVSSFVPQVPDGSG